MQFHSAISERESSGDAIDEVIDQVQQRGDTLDIAFLFFTAHHNEEASQIAEQVWQKLDPQALIGCSCEGVIGGDREIERSRGISLFAGKLPNVRIHPFHISTDDWRELITEPDVLRDRLGIGESTRGIIGFGDSWTTPLTQFLSALDQNSPGIPLIGGMASGARSPGQNVLIHNDQTRDDGFVGVSLSGDDLEIQTIVSQGCKPIGQSMIITKSHDNVIEHLGGKPAMLMLREVVTGLDESDQQLLQNGLLIGRAINEYRERFGRGDFLVRNITGADQDSGAIEIADYVRTGQTVQFHVRDAATADEDLSLMLEKDRIGALPAGALLFSCNGRGTRLFARPSHDINVAHRQMPGTPVAGFFAAGEIGPIGGRNFVHGHTASFALFRTRKI